jgi:hypothetical protein
MRKTFLILAALALSTCGCRLFCGDCPSRSYHYDPAPVMLAAPVGQPVVPHDPGAR